MGQDATRVPLPRVGAARLPAGPHGACQTVRMEQRVSLISLGVQDLERARRFYEAMGWTTGASPSDDVVFFQAGGMIVALWRPASPAAASGVRAGGGGGGGALGLHRRSPPAGGAG